MGRKKATKIAGIPGATEVLGYARRCIESTSPIEAKVSMIDLFGNLDTKFIDDIFVGRGLIWTYDMFEQELTDIAITMLVVHRSMLIC